MKANARMTNLLAKCGSAPTPVLSSLEALIDQGLVRTSGCILLRSQEPLVDPGARAKFADKTGFECFVNHIHLEDYVKDSPGECFLLRQALAFGKRLSALKVQEGITDPMLYIIAADDGAINVRFHVLRQGEEWLSNDIEKYEEAVAAFELSGSAPALP